MKAKLLLICILTFLVFGLSSCFLKKLFKHNEHQIEHRGDYKKMGKHAQYYPSKEERIRKPKHHRHGKRYKRKLEKRRRKAAEERKAQSIPDNGKDQNYQTNWKDSTGQNVPVPLNVAPPVPGDTVKAQPAPKEQAIPSNQPAPPPPQEQKEEKPKKKNKHKKDKTPAVDSNVPTDQNAKSDSTGQK